RSSITAYTTATDVVESATPASQLARASQPSPNRATSIAPKNGARNPTRPSPRVSRQLSRSAAGSSSAPARKVSMIEPPPAKKTTHGSLAPRIDGPNARTRTNAPATPTVISVNATETPSHADSAVATSAIPNQIAAVNHTCSIRSPLPGGQKNRPLPRYRL